MKLNLNPILFQLDASIGILLRRGIARDYICFIIRQLSI